ncbi:uncharacterized protein LOC141653421 [Silene latifolia]|uniref:uncharacterized protein LOC141653421 n=1 Tax=Silene latifolia TaxID=37657 RepID=UPI003D7842B3
MATTMKGSSVGKEKKGTSPSTSLIKKSPKPSTSTPASSPSSSTNEKMSSPTDGKPIPNYLRPTASSNRDFSKLPKKPTTDPTPQKPALNRRRSFDRPPPVSQVQKAISNVPGTSEIKHLRSSSFSHKSGTSSGSSIRPAASDKTYARTTSSLKEGKTDSSLSKSRTIKKSTLSTTSTPTTKKDAKRPTSSSSTKKAPKSMTSESSIDHDNMAIDHLTIDDELVGIENEVQSLPEISEMPDTNQELGDPTITVTDQEVKEVEDVADNLAITNERKAVDHNLEEKNENHIVIETQPEPENVVNLGNDQNLTVEEHNVTVDSDEGDTETQHDEKKETEFAEENKEEEADDGKKETEFAEEKKEEEEEEEEKADDREKETEVAEEKKEEEAALEKEAEKKEELSDEKVSVASPANGPAKVQTSLGKKDKQDYNNIIEETSSKLMGGRKNKVLALAGAFETVISLQDTNNN